MIRQKVKIYFAVLMGLILVLMYCLYSVYVKEQQITQLKKDRFDFYSLAIQLEENHFDFNYIVNQYIVADNEQYTPILKPFVALVSFDNIEKLRNKALADIYFTTKQYEILDIQREQFTHFFDTIELSNNLFKRLLKASRFSLEVLRLNIEAINAYNGFIKDTNGQYTIKTEPDKQKAFNILYSEKYRILNKEIQNNITEIVSVIETFMYDHINEQKIEQSQLYNMAALILFLIILMIALGINYSNNRIIKPLTKILFWVKQIKKGNYVLENKATSKDEIGELMAAFSKMSHKIQENIATLEKTSLTDQLTNLNNRRSIDGKLEELYENYKRYQTGFSIILLDIDHFKSVNDTYGHDVGDSVLKEFAAILKQHVRKTDVVGRWGGEEFLILCPNTNYEEAKVVAENLRKTIESFTFTTVGHKTSSFGVFELANEMSIAQLIEKADAALYHSKNSGRNCVS